jgi:tetratricopeptide (TPR) repeat protein
MTWLLMAVLAQSPVIQDGVFAQLAFHRGLQLRADGKLADSAAAFRYAADMLGVDSFPPSPALSFKAGNAWFLAGDLPRAIAAYRRGLALDPTDSRLRTALAHAREQVQYAPAPDLARRLRPGQEIWPPDLSLQSMGRWAFGLYCAGCLAAMRWRMTRHRRWLIAAGLLLAAGLVPVIGSGVEWWHARRNAAEPIVVVLRDTPLRIGNGSDYPSKLDLPRGCEVRRLFERAGWLQVETNGGTVGWVPTENVVPSR